MRTSDSDPQGKSARLYFMDENPSRDGQRGTLCGILSKDFIRLRITRAADT